MLRFSAVGDGVGVAVGAPGVSALGAPSTSGDCVGSGVLVAVPVTTGVGVLNGVAVKVAVAVGVFVGVAVGVPVGVTAGVGATNRPSESPQGS